MERIKKRGRDVCDSASGKQPVHLSYHLIGTRNVLQYIVADDAPNALGLERDTGDVSHNVHTNVRMNIYVHYAKTRKGTRS